MPLTNKEKMARRRERQKADPVKYAAALEKDRLRKKVNRQIFKESATEKEMKDFKCREVQRVMGYYSKKKSLPHQGGQDPVTPEKGQGSPFSTRQSLGKAAKRASRSLPNSPRKKRCVVKRLVDECGLKLQDPKSTSKCHGLSLSEETVATVVTFFNSDDVSWQAPGKKDRIIQREDVHNSFTEVEEMWYSAVPVPDTHSVHYCATVTDQRYIIVGETSTDLSMRKVRILKGQAFDSDSSDEDEMVEGEPVPTLQINDIKPFDWVVVKYEDVFYPGEVKQVKLEENEVEVQVMHVSKTGKYYYWPKDEDCICYLLKDVIKKIGSPIPCEGTREQYKFNDSINVY
ncbi:hypothetical protein J6590_028428 [Homalodisca vitripennis]|nr:hypothetical protein J6590_028428 [Homalodisca vitripennis]